MRQCPPSLAPLVLAPLALALIATLAGCAAPPPPAPPPCPAHVMLSPADPARGLAVEDTPGGRCLATRAERGDVAAILRLGDFYSGLSDPVPLIDRHGRQVHWYRLAGDHGSPAGAWAAVALLDTDHDRQVPNDALAYLFTALKGGIPAAGDYLVEQWRRGRVDPGKLWALRRWLGRPGALPEARRAAIIAGLNGPADTLAPE